MGYWRGIIEEYREFLAVTDATPIITLGEGNTPLVPAHAISRELGPGFEVFLKYEGLNPTGSFKDRGMTMAVSKAMEDGTKAVMCASTGNTSAAAAAYAAQAGIECMVVIPEGSTALGKLAQALVYGAKVFSVRGNFDDALRVVREVTESQPITLVNSVNCWRLEGQKTGSFEIIDQLDGEAPDYHFIPVGNAGNITAYWRGYKEYQQAGRVNRLPAMMGFQAAGAAPIVLGHVVPKPETIATAIKIGNPASWQLAEAARDESGGTIDMVTDEEILEAYKFLANRVGIFCEPASAASVAGLFKMHRAGFFKAAPVQSGHDGTGRRTTRIVCVLTGHGLKDPDTAINATIEGAITIEPNAEAVLEHVALAKL